MEGLNFEILRCPEALQEKICSRHFGTQKTVRQRTARSMFGSFQSIGIDRIWEMRKGPSREL